MVVHVSPETEHTLYNICGSLIVAPSRQGELLQTHYHFKLDFQKVDQHTFI